MKKVFLVAGELSGDKLGAWYVKKNKDNENVVYEGVGGDFLEGAGVKLYERFEVLNVVGFVELIKHAKFILQFLNKLSKYIVAEDFDEVVVIDFPGFNLRLIKKIKKLNPNIKITYLSPPQLWVWGKSRMKILKNFCDDVIVLYPFEVNWYKERGLDVRWVQYPFYDALKPYFKDSCDDDNSKFVQQSLVKPAFSIALIPGSRMVEIKRLLPLFIKVAQRFKLAHPEAKIVLPLAESIDRGVVEKMIRAVGVGRWGSDILIVQGEKEKLSALSKCSLALTKPGTITLELALLSIPAVVAYKASWITYFLARMLVSIKYMALPNLLLDEPVYPEFIQSDCTQKKIFKGLEDFYKEISSVGSCASMGGCAPKKMSSANEKHRVFIKKLDALKNMLS